MCGDGGYTQRARGLVPAGGGALSVVLADAVVSLDKDSATD